MSESDGEGGIAAFSDPETLADRRGVTVREKSREVDGETFDLFTTVDGVAAVGIARADGAVLLWEGPHGWTLPFAFVEPDDDWLAAGRDVIAELTGQSFDLAAVEELRRVENERDDGDDRVTSYEIVFRARTVTDESVIAELDAFEADEDHPDVDWFDEIPENADLVDDVRLFLD